MTTCETRRRSIYVAPIYNTKIYGLRVVFVAEQIAPGFFLQLVFFRKIQLREYSLQYIGLGGPGIEYALASRTS
jgi:hypothetical protein